MVALRQMDIEGTDAGLREGERGQREVDSLHPPFSGFNFVWVYIVQSGGFPNGFFTQAYHLFIHIQLIIFSHFFLSLPSPFLLSSHLLLSCFI